MKTIDYSTKPVEIQALLDAGEEITVSGSATYLLSEPLRVTKTSIIHANSNTWFNGQNKTRVFEVSAGARLELHSGAIRSGKITGIGSGLHGVAGSAQGAGLFNAGNTLLDGTRVDFCVAQAGKLESDSGANGIAQGGAIYNSGELALQHVTFDSCVAKGSDPANGLKHSGGPAQGGAIFNVGRLAANWLKATNCQVFGGNRASATLTPFNHGPASGGFIYSSGGLLVINDSDFLNCLAQSSGLYAKGGAIFCDSEGQLFDLRVGSNACFGVKAPGFGQTELYGAGVYLAGKGRTISDCSFVANTFRGHPDGHGNAICSETAFTDDNNEFGTGQAVEVLDGSHLVAPTVPSTEQGGAMDLGSDPLNPVL